MPQRLSCDACPGQARSHASRAASAMNIAASDRLTQRIVEQPILDLLPLPIEEVRRRLNILEPTTYHQALNIWEGEGVNPHALLGQQPA